MWGKSHISDASVFVAAATGFTPGGQNLQVPSDRKNLIAAQLGMIAMNQVDKEVPQSQSESGQESERRSMEFSAKVKAVLNEQSLANSNLPVSAIFCPGSQHEPWGISV